MARGWVITLGCDYALANGKGRIAEWIIAHFETTTASATRLAGVSPSFAQEALDALERERDAALARLDTTYAAWNAANDRWNDTNAAEVDALIALCAHRCSTLEDSEFKFQYLFRFKDCLTEEQTDAIFASLLPKRA